MAEKGQNRNSLQALEIELEIGDEAESRPPQRSHKKGRTHYRGAASANPTSNPPDVIASRFLADPTVKALHDAFLLGWNITELKSRIQMEVFNYEVAAKTPKPDPTQPRGLIDDAQSLIKSVLPTLKPTTNPDSHRLIIDPSDNTWLGNVWRALFNQIASMHYTHFPDSDNRQTYFNLLQDKEPADLLPYLYQPHFDPPVVTDFQNVGIKPILNNDKKPILDTFNLYEVTRRIINCLTLLYSDPNDSIIPTTLAEYQKQLKHNIFAASSFPKDFPKAKVGLSKNPAIEVRPTELNISLKAGETASETFYIYFRDISSWTADFGAPTPLNHWLSINPAVVKLEKNRKSASKTYSAVMEVNVDSTGMKPGVYQGQLQIQATSSPIHKFDNQIEFDEDKNNWSSGIDENLLLGEAALDRNFLLDETADEKIHTLNVPLVITLYPTNHKTTEPTTTFDQTRYDGICLLSGLAVRFLEAWDGFLRENYYDGGTILKDETELAAYEAGRTLATLSWCITVANQDLQNNFKLKSLISVSNGASQEQTNPNYATTDLTYLQELYANWSDVFSKRSIAHIQHQLDALTTVFDDAYYRIFNITPTAKEKETDPVLLPINPDLPSQAFRSVKQSLSFWQRTIEWVGEDDGQTWMLTEQAQILQQQIKNDRRHPTSIANLAVKPNNTLPLTIPPNSIFTVNVASTASQTRPSGYVLLVSVKTIVGIAILDESGKARFNNVAAAVGDKLIRVIYAGDVNYLPSIGSFSPATNTHSASASTPNNTASFGNGEITNSRSLPPFLQNRTSLSQNPPPTTQPAALPAKANQVNLTLSRNDVAPILTDELADKLRVALIEQSDSWKSLISCKESLRGFTNTSLTENIINKVMADFESVSARSLEEVGQQAEAIIAQDVAQAVTPIGAVVQKLSPYLIFGALVLVLVVVLLIVFPDLTKQVTTILGVILGGGIGSAVLGSKNILNSTKSATTVPAQTTTAPKTTTTAVNSGLLQRLSNMLGVAENTLFEAFQNGYQQIQIEYSALNYQVAVTYPLIEFFILNMGEMLLESADISNETNPLMDGQKIVIKSSYDFLNQIVWSEEDRDQEIKRVARAAFGPIGVVVGGELNHKPPTATPTAK